MAGIWPLSNGETWEGATDGRTWEISGDLVAYTFPGDLPYTFTLEYATRNTGAGTWNAFTDYSTLLMDLRVTRSVRDWYLGPQAASGSVTLDDTAGDHRCPPGGLLRLSVTTENDNTYIVFEGIVVEQRYSLSADRYPTVIAYVTDSFGFEAQRTYTPAADTDATGTLLATIIDDYSWADRDAGWDTDGVEQTVEAEEYNLPDLLSTLTRGDVGLLFTTREGEWAYLTQGWWNDNRTTAAAAIGDSAPPDAYTYMFPLTSTTPSNTVYDIINDATWTMPNADPTTTTATDTSSIAAYQQRNYDDETWVTASTEGESAVARLVRLYGGLETRITQVAFPADLSSDSQEYAGQAEIGDFLNVAMESLDGYWSEWVQCHVLSVTQRWGPYNGWETILGVTAGLWEDWDAWILDTSELDTETIPG